MLVGTVLVLPGVVFLGAGAPRCGVLGCWCSQVWCSWVLVLPGVVFLGAGAPRCGVLGCWCSQVWCSWVLVLSGEKANQCHPPAIPYFDNGTSPHSMGIGYIRRYE